MSQLWRIVMRVGGESGVEDGGITALFSKCFQRLRDRCGYDASSREERMAWCSSNTCHK
jgi:hypothetical protein